MSQESEHEQALLVQASKPESSVETVHCGAQNRSWCFAEVYSERCVEGRAGLHYRAVCRCEAEHKLMADPMVRRDMTGSVLGVLEVVVEENLGKVTLLLVPSHKYSSLGSLNNAQVVGLQRTLRGSFRGVILLLFLPLFKE